MYIVHMTVTLESPTVKRREGSGNLQLFHWHRVEVVGHCCAAGLCEQGDGQGLAGAASRLGHADQGRGSGGRQLFCVPGHKLPRHRWRRLCLPRPSGPAAETVAAPQILVPGAAPPLPQPILKGVAFSHILLSEQMPR